MGKPSANGTKLDRLIAEQGGCCFWCRRVMRWNGHNRPTFEHFVPKKYGGTNRSRNKVVAHNLCNRSRGHSWPSVDDMRRFVELKGDDGKAELARLAILIHAQTQLPEWEIL